MRFFAYSHDMDSEKSSTAIVTTLLSVSCQLRCIECGEEEFVVALDDLPIDGVFAENYFCDDCETKTLDTRVR